ncbi:MAG: hypothetical protein IJ341_02645 [Bacteroidales bacterium]|nr:hypothetical protein [Bacteroidales bacterium]
MASINEALVDAIRRTIKVTNLTLKNGIIIYDIYADHRDKLEKETIISFFGSDRNPRDLFFEAVSSSYDVSYTEALEDTIGEIKKNWSSTKYPYHLNKDFIEDWIQDHLAIGFPYDHYLSQQVCVNVTVDTGDANFEFVSNSIFPHYDSNEKDGIPDEASILWLAKQQGYTKAALKRAMRHPESTGSILLKSIRDEVLNCTTHMNALIFLVRMSLGELFTLYERQNMLKTRGSIVLSKQSRCGLYDAWSGAGSLMEIDLEKDVVLSLSNVYSIIPDGCEHNYGVAEVYGVTTDFWTPTLISK